MIKKAHSYNTLNGCSCLLAQSSWTLSVIVDNATCIRFSSTKWTQYFDFIAANAENLVLHKLTNNSSCVALLDDVLHFWHQFKQLEVGLHTENFVSIRYCRIILSIFLLQ